ncbi:ABC transporter ATP-binding protein [bacterium]|nr:ABC transporter ATP-binding protein [bacterium]MCI0601740.1 ABC transporter ATP-binding protein [bacterium]
MNNGNGGPVIIARGLSKKFDEAYAVRDVSLEIHPGQIFGFIGPSGCGKTSTVRLLTGYYLPSEGEAHVLGQSSVKLNDKERRRIGYMPQLFALYPDLTVWENLNFSASLYGMGLLRGRRLKKILDFVDLKDDRRKLTSKISGGMQRRLSLAAAMVHQPDILFLDEPTAGIDPVLRRKFWDYFQELRNQGRTLFVTTQYVSEAAYCDRIGVMVEGSLLCVDTPEGLRKRAYGGEMVDITTEENQPLDLNYVHQLTELPFLKGRPKLMDENKVRVLVNEASTAIPALIEFTNSKSIAVKSIEPYAPPFDDVFVHLVKKEEEPS